MTTGSLANSYSADILVKFLLGAGDSVEKTVKLKVGMGEFLFKLDDILAEMNISKNKLMRDTETDFKVIQRISSGTITKIDIYVLARICDYLNCNLSDIIEYKHG